MSEQQAGEWQSPCPHPEAVGTRWGDQLSEGRQAELATLAERQSAWAVQPAETRGTSPLAEAGRLAGADVGWLAVLALVSQEGGAAHDAAALAAAHARLRAAAALARGEPVLEQRLTRDLSRLHLEGAILAEAPVEGADLHGAHLERARLDGAHLERAILGGAHLERATFSAAHLERADLSAAHLERAFLAEAHLERAYLHRAHLEAARLDGAHLERADLHGAHLKWAILAEAHLEGADFRGAHLERASVSGASFDKTSRLNDAALTGVSFDQVAFDNANLTVVDWTLVSILGDEVETRKPRRILGEPKEPATRLNDFKAAVRANRLLAVALRAQGLNEDADRFAYRDQFLQRQVLRRQRKFGAYVGSVLLDAVSGYGYRPVRSVVAYVLIICLFAGAYLLNAQFAAPHLTWDEALVLSISSFHGRGFFTSGISLGATLARLAAAEAIIGLLIEITFIATFTQRFFAR